MRLSRRWWEQPALDILGIRAVHAEVGGGGDQKEGESRLGEDEGENGIIEEPEKFQRRSGG